MTEDEKQIDPHAALRERMATWPGDRAEMRVSGDDHDLAKPADDHPMRKVVSAIAHAYWAEHLPETFLRNLLNCLPVVIELPTDDPDDPFYRPVKGPHGATVREVYLALKARWAAKAEAEAVGAECRSTAVALGAGVLALAFARTGDGDLLGVFEDLDRSEHAPSPWPSRELAEWDKARRQGVALGVLFGMAPSPSARICSASSGSARRC